MELWLDTINYQLIEDAAKRIDISGITTNPSILSKVKESPEKIIKKLLDIQPGLLAVQVMSTDEISMLNQAKKLHRISDRIIVKIPVCKAGLLVMRSLSLENIPTMATAIFEPIQVYLSILSGAKYAAPYLSKIENTGGNYLTVIADMVSVIKNNNSELKLLTASIKNKKQIIDCALLGAHAITLPEEAYSDLISDHPKTIQCINIFNNDWEKNTIAKESEIFC